MDTQVDAFIFNHGSLVGIRPETPAAQQFIADNVEAEGYQWLGRTLMVEPRYVGAIIEGMQADGLVVEA